MLKAKIQILILLALMSVLSACHSTNTSDANNNNNNNDDPPPINTKNEERAASINTQLGLAYLQQGSVERAKSKLLLAMKQAPENSSTLSAMAYYLEKTGDDTQAEDYYRRAVSISSSNGDAQNNYGTFLCRKGRYQESIQRFLLATKDQNFISTSGAYENAGLCSLKIPDEKMAKVYFEKTLAQDPQRMSSLLELVKLGYKQGNYQAANDYLQHSLRITKLTPDLLKFGIQIAEKLGDQKLVTDYRQLLQQQYATASANDKGSI